MQNAYSTPILVTTLLSLIAALIGAFTVHWLARSRDHAIWERDRRMNEWRELLSALARAQSEMLKAVRNQGKIDAHAIAQAKTEVLANAQATINDRILIADEVEKLQIDNLWFSAFQQYGEDENRTNLIIEITSIRKLIVTNALKL